MKKIFCIILALICSIYIVFDISFNFMDYLKSIGSKLPDTISYIDRLLNFTRAFNGFSFDASSLSAFFNSCGAFFSCLWNCLLAIIDIPIALIEYLYKILVAILPFITSGTI